MMEISRTRQRLVGLCQGRDKNLYQEYAQVRDQWKIKGRAHLPILIWKMTIKTVVLVCYISFILLTLWGGIMLCYSVHRVSCEVVEVDDCVFLVV